MTPEALRAQFDVMAEAPNGMAKLRELVLQLAVRGKLVVQNPDDAPAQVPYPLDVDDVSRETPHGWAWSRLCDIGTIGPRNVLADQTTVGFCPMALIPERYGEAPRFEERLWRTVKTGYTHFAEGDVVVAKITPCFQNGKAAVMRGVPGGAGAGTTELHVFRA